MGRLLTRLSFVIFRYGSDGDLTVVHWVLGSVVVIYLHIVALLLIPQHLRNMYTPHTSRLSPTKPLTFTKSQPVTSIITQLDSSHSHRVSPNVRRDRARRASVYGSGAPNDDDPRDEHELM